MIAVAERCPAFRTRSAHRPEQLVRVESDALDRLFAARYSLFAARQAAYDAANEQIAFNSLPSTFDANGNQTTSTDVSGTTTYTWDARNRLIAQAGPGVSASFVYDALGRRASKTINGVTTSYLYDGNDIVQEIGGSAVGASYVRSLNIDEPFVRQTSAGNEFYHVDALGSSLALSNAAGVATVSYAYEAFGKTTITGSSANPFQYTGRENDGGGLYYYRARYHSPILHRFLREDPFQMEQRRPTTINYRKLYRNAYQYVENDPISLKDPSGEISVGGAAAVGIPLAAVGVAAWCISCAYPDYIAGLDKFPGGSSSQKDIRHCTVSCQVSKKCGPACAWAAGWLNELNGLRYGGYSLDDFDSNDRGRSCTGTIDCKTCCQKCPAKPQQE